MSGQAMPLHPFFPPHIELPTYKANVFNTLELCAAFGTATVVILGAALSLINKYNRNLSKADQALVSWFIFTGAIHFFFEGYFAVNHSRMPQMMDFFGQLWKEYSLSDSRYMTSDPFVLCMETTTAFAWGPLSFLTAYLIATDSPYRHPVQALVSTGQFYGDWLYYSTSLFDDYFANISYCRPERSYYWGYFIFMNTFWLLIPGYCIYSSMKTCAKAIAATSKAAKSKKSS